MVHPCAAEGYASLPLSRREMMIYHQLVKPYSNTLPKYSQHTRRLDGNVICSGLKKRHKSGLFISILSGPISLPPVVSFQKQNLCLSSELSP